MGKLARENRLRREAEQQRQEAPVQVVDSFSAEALKIIQVVNQNLSERFDAVSEAWFQLGPPVSFGAHREYSPW